MKLYRGSVSLGMAVALIPALALPLLAQSSSTPRAAKVEAVVVDLDDRGSPASVRVNSMVRVYANGSFSLEDGGRTLSGSASGSRDFTGGRKLRVENGLVVTPDGPRALPLHVRTRYKIDGQPIGAKELAGRRGTVEVAVTVTNRTVRAERVTYVDSTTGEDRAIEGVSAIPLRVELRGVTLPDAAFDIVQTNGLLTRNEKNDASLLSWSAVLAPPAFPGSATFSFTVDAKNFALDAPTIVAHLGLGDNVPKPVKDAMDKGGATAATLRGYLNQFGDGFGQLNGGLTQVQSGVNAILAGLNDELKPGLSNTRFDRPLYDEDSTLARNQPGLREALVLLADGAKTLKAGIGTARAGVSSGRLDAPGIKEGLQLVIAGLAGVPGTSSPNIRAGMLQVQAGVASVIGGLTQLKTGVARISAGIGNPGDVVYDCDGNRATTGDIVPSAASCGNPNTVLAVATSQAGALTLIKGGLDKAGAGIGAATDIVYDCDGNTATTGDIVASPASCGNPNTIKAVPTSLASALTLLKAGADQSAAGIGSTQSFDCTGDGVADAYGGGCNEGTPGARALTMESALVQVKAVIDFSAATLGGGHPLAPYLAAASAGIGTGTEFDCAPYNGVPDDPTTCPATAKPLTILATAEALKSGAVQTAAAMGAGTEFDCAPYNGVPDNPATCPATAKPLTVRATVAALASGVGQLAAGVGTGTEFDCTGDGVADAYGGGCNEATPNALPLSVRATSKLFKVALDFSVLPGIGATTDAPTASLLGGLAALDAGLTQLVGGVDAAVTGLGGLVAGTSQLAAGLGDLKADGSAAKAVTTRVSKFGNSIESPASALWGLQSLEDTVRGKFVTGVDEILAALGDPAVTGETVLSGLRRLADGTALMVTGSASGRDGAGTLANSVEKSAFSGDVLAALQLAGIDRAAAYGAFVSAPDGARTTVLFVYRMSTIR